VTRDEAKQLLPIITAYANGETVQFKTFDRWEDYEIGDAPDFTASPSSYRIKPKPLEYWAVVNKNGAVVHWYYCECDAVSHAASNNVWGSGWRAVHMREVE
jgi:hypothetical protein